jgi:hypothetical protein
MARRLAHHRFIIRSLIPPNRAVLAQSGEAVRWQHDTAL